MFKRRTHKPNHSPDIESILLYPDFAGRVATGATEIAPLYPEAEQDDDLALHSTSNHERLRKATLAVLASEGVINISSGSRYDVGRFLNGDLGDIDQATAAFQNLRRPTE